MENEPRPTDVRPIARRTITINGTTISFPYNVYHGTFDIETGELVIEPKKD